MLFNRKFILLFSFICLGAGAIPSSMSTESSSLDWDDVVALDAPKVKVRVVSDRALVRIESDNLKVEGRWTRPNSDISFHRVGNRAIWISAGQKLAETDLDEALNISGSRMTISDVRVPKSLTLRGRSDGKIDVYAELALEKYVEGVLAGEMPTHWPIESLKAQAVAARSYLLALRRNPKHKNYDIDSSQYDQVFKAVESLPKSAREQIRRAVEESQGLILKSPEEYPVQAYFHSDCGGVTEKASTVWGKSGVQGKKGPACPFNPGHPWTLSVSKNKLAKLFGLKALAKMLVAQTTEAGRAVQLNAVSSTGFVREVSAERLRRDLGYSDMRSTLFEISENGENIEFRGRGFGHGVGLCQWGSKLMAENGKNFIEILSLYYPRARLVPISRGVQIGLARSSAGR